MNKYDLYMVKVVTDNNEMIIKSDKDTTSYIEMKELFETIKESNTSGNVLFIGINSMGYTTIDSLNPTKELEIDIVVSRLIENMKWLLEYSYKGHELLGSINMSRDVFLKNIELFDSYNMDEDFSNSNTKESIFEELKKILIMRRNIKYSNLLARKIYSRINLKRILTVLEKSKEAMSQSSSVNISPSTIEMEGEYDIGNLFNLDTIDKISEIRKQHDKILIKDNKIIGYKKASFIDDSDLDDYDEVVYPSETLDTEYPNEDLSDNYDLEITDIDKSSDIYKNADILTDEDIDSTDTNTFSKLQENNHFYEHTDSRTKYYIYTFKNVFK